MSVRFQPYPQTRDRARDSGDDWHFRLSFWALRKLSRQPGHVMLLSNNPSETCGLRLLNNSHGCIGGRTMTKGARVAAPVRSAHPHDLKMRFFLFHAADEDKGFKCDGLIIMRSSENERHTLINLCFVAVWSDPFQILWKQFKYMIAMLFCYLLLSWSQYPVSCNS